MFPNEAPLLCYMADHVVSRDSHHERSAVGDDVSLITAQEEGGSIRSLWKVGLPNQETGKMQSAREVGAITAILLAGDSVMMVFSCFQGVLQPVVHSTFVFDGVLGRVFLKWHVTEEVGEVIGLSSKASVVPYRDSGLRIVLSLFEMKKGKRIK